MEESLFQEEARAQHYTVRDFSTGTEEIEGKTFHKMEAHLTDRYGGEGVFMLFCLARRATSASGIIQMPFGADASILVFHYQEETESPPLEADPARRDDLRSILGSVVVR